MPSSKIVCPDCKAVLKPAKPVPDGKKVVCPRCKNTFVTPGAVEDEAAVKPAGKKQAAGKQPAAKAAAKKPAAPAPPPPTASDEDEDEGGGTYGVIKPDEKEEEENKPDITYAPDLSIRDLRGPAQAAIVAPSNGLMVAGAIAVVAFLLGIAIQVWPFIFAEYVVDHEKFLWEYYTKGEGKGTPKAKERVESLPKDRKDCTREEQDLIDEETDWQVKMRSTNATIGFLCIIYNAFMIIGAVKMQNVESYGWSMAAAIMGVFPFTGMGWLISLPYGIWGLIALRDEKVIAGFNYKPE